MFLTVHTAAATVIGKHIISAPLAFLLGLLSHFLLDLIPHGDSDLDSDFIKSVKKKGISKKFLMIGMIDLFVLILLLFYFVYNFEFISQSHVIWAIIGGILPDILMVIYRLTKFKWLKWIYDLHEKNHALITGKIIKDYNIKYGLIFQITLMIIFILLATN